MFFWSRFPFLRVVGFFILGILLGIYSPWLNSQALIGLGISSVCLIIFILLRKKWLLKANPVYGVILSIVFVFLGFIFAVQATDTNKADHLIHFNNGSYYTAKVVSEPELRGRYLRLKVDVLSVKLNDWQEATGKVLAYINLSSGQLPEYGDELLIKSFPKPVSPPLNPHEFNYKQYLEINHVYHQDFIDSAEWHIIKTGEISLRKISIDIRNSLEKKLELFILQKDDLAIAKALILGDKNDLDKETKEVYALSGAMHILAVSGLHVGVIYIILLWLLGQRNGTITSPKLVAFVVIPALWIYALITGLSPSVLRAVIMFSFMAIGQILNRRSNSLNTLAVSAFLMLLVDPFMILSVGFQLSYLAVAGIIFLYPKIERLYYPTNSFVRFFWQLTALSIAAQLATAPLSAYYFHRFPTYFLFSNLIVIPAAILIVWGGLVLLGLGSISTSLGIIIGKILGLVIFSMNTFLKYIAKLPLADINNLAPSLLNTWYIYGFVIFLGMYIFTKRKTYFWLTSILILLIGINSYQKFRLNQELKQIVFYSVGNSWAVDLIEGATYMPIADSLSSNTIDYSIQPHRLFHNLLENKKPLPIIENDELGHIFVWNGVTVLLANPCLNRDKLPMNFDYILFKTGQSGQNCYQDQIVMCKFVDNNEVNYRNYSLRKEGALIITI